MMKYWISFMVASPSFSKAPTFSSSLPVCLTISSS